MTRFLFIVSALLLLSGCVTGPTPWGTAAPDAQSAPRSLVSDLFTKPADQETQPAQTAAATQPSQPTTSPWFGQGGTYDNTRPGSFSYDSGPVGFAPPSSPAVKVALLVPLSGAHKELGEDLLRAAQMAVFDMGYENFQLLPRDTQATPQGARKAAEDAIQSGAQLILGPLFSESVRAAGAVARRNDVNMLAFSTDWSLAGRNTYIMGFLPFSQVQRITEYAARQGIENIAVLSPNTEYGNTVLSAYNALAYQIGLNTVDSLRFYPGAPDTNARIREFTRYDSRTAAKEELEKLAEERAEQEQQKGQKTTNTNTPSNTASLYQTALGQTPPGGTLDVALDPEAQREEELREQMELPFEAILMPIGGEEARSVASMLAYYEAGSDRVQKLGTGLWDDPRLAGEETLQGAWFAAPSPRLRQDFEQRYRSLYSNKPPRLATLAYDAAALAAVLARTGYEKQGKPAFDHAFLTSPNGFSGLDGVFRFRSDGIIERGLAVLEISNRRIVIRDPAPQTFERWLGN